MTPEELKYKIENAAISGAEVLDLSGEDITELPPEIGALTLLLELDLSETKITELPPEIGALTSLQELNLRRTGLTALPPEIDALKSLQTLILSGTKITALPSEIGALTLLQELHLIDTPITALPPEIGGLTALIYLDLEGTAIRRLQPETFTLTSLQDLYLEHSAITALPPKIGDLTSLQTLDLSRTKITALPPEIGALTSLLDLDVSRTGITALPPEFGALTSLEYINLDETNITTPPPEVTRQGMDAIRAFFTDREAATERLWTSKLVVVGQGAVGKTSLLRNLMKGEKFDPKEDQTHGLEIRDVHLDHPTEDAVMTLRAWDFGGQDIYHATHQFYLTNRSLFVLVWNARQGFEDSRVQYWLETIQAKAPDSPILMVATHADQNVPDIPLVELQESYPNIIGNFAVNNQRGDGIAEFKSALAKQTAELPLMGEDWPKNWMDAADAIRALDDLHAPPAFLRQLMDDCGVPEDRHGFVLGALDELGDILYYGDDDELRDLVILKPQWLSQEIAKVLDSEEVAENRGIFTRKLAQEYWAEYDQSMRRHFLRLMEKFDLSYRIAGSDDESLVVERLQFDPPEEYREKWSAKSDEPDCRELAIRYRFSTLPPGIPTWFIARANRFTMVLHWRRGALFQQKDETHLGLVEADAHAREIRLTVRGAAPGDFFNLLKGGLELTHNRYEGLEPEKLIPCPGHDGVPCPHEFNLKHLEMRLSDGNIQCPESGQDMKIGELLLGWYVSPDPNSNDLIAELADGFKNFHEEYGHDQEIALQRERSKIKSEAPGLIVMRPVASGKTRRAVVGKKMQMHLCCEYPGEQHTLPEEKPYGIDISAEWMQAAAPYLRGTFKVLKFVAPFVAPGIGLNDEVMAKDLKFDLQMMDKIAAKFPEINIDADPDLGGRGKETRMEGADMRKLQAWLEEEDPKRHYQSLVRILTPEGHYFWLCPHHAAEFD